MQKVLNYFLLFILLGCSNNNEKENVDEIQLIVKAKNINTKVEGQLTDQYLIICLNKDHKKKVRTNCPLTFNKKEKAYLIQWTRFGTIAKFKWSRNSWNRI